MHQKRTKNLDWLPDQVFTTNGSEYLPSNEAFSKTTTNAARPSLKEKQNKSVLVTGIYKYCIY